MMSSVLCKLKTRRTETAQIKNSYWSFAPHIFLRNNSDLLSTNSLHSSLSSWVCWLISGSNTRTLFSSSKWNPAGPSAIFDRDLNVSQKALRLTNIFRLVENHDDGFVDDDRKWDTVHCASAVNKFRRRGVVDDAKHSRVTSSCSPQASAGITPCF